MNSKTESKENKDWGKNPEYSRTVEQLENINIMGTQETEEREKRTTEMFDTMITENFSKVMPGTKPQIQEAQINTKKKNYTEAYYKSN